MVRDNWRFALDIVATLLVVLTSSCAYAQSESKSCALGLRIAIDYDYIHPSYGAASGVKVKYWINRSPSALTAWVEAWDGGIRLFRQGVPIKPHGEVDWMQLREVPETPSSLSFAILDPELPLFGDDKDPTKEGIDYLSRFWGGFSQDEPGPFSLGTGVSYRLPEGSERGDLQLVGLFAGTPTEILLEQQDNQGHWIAREYLRAEVLDKDHIEVRIPERYLNTAGALGLSNKFDGLEWELGTEVDPPQQKIYVSSKDSPKLSEITPSKISAAEADEGPFHIPIHLHGSGFTPDSVVVQSLYDHDLKNSGQTRFISASELEYDMYEDEVVIEHKWSASRPIRLWVVTGDWLHVSEPQDIQIESSPMFPPDPAKATHSRIVSIQPDPIPMSDPVGPVFLIVDIRGEDFRPNESVVAVVGKDGKDRTIRLKTRFISPQELRAWLPREAWSEHRLRYRFEVKTPTCVCAIDALEAEDN